MRSARRHGGSAWPRRLGPLLAPLLFAALVCGSCAPEPRPVVKTAVPTPTIDRTGLRLVLDENFDGMSLDDKVWNDQLAWGRVNGEEMQYYSPDGVRVEKGSLVLTARKQPTGRRDYTSGVIASFDKYEFTYGYVEMRAKLPKGEGLWPALWLLSAKEDDPNEIDILEFIGGDPYRTQMTLHWGPGAKNKYTMTWTGPDYSAGYHMYGMEWQPDGITWYVDGIERFRVTDHIPAAPMYIIANLAVGGRYPGPPDATTPFPSDYVIDYIRVYRRD